MIDVGGSGLKATVLDPAGEPLHKRVRVDTAYPCPPDKLVADLVGLVEPLPAYERVSVGFPGVVRGGRVVTAPHFVTRHGPGTKVDSDLASQWDHFELAAALAATGPAGLGGVEEGDGLVAVEAERGVLAGHAGPSDPVDRVGRDGALVERYSRFIQGRLVLVGPVLSVSPGAN